MKIKAKHTIKCERCSTTYDVDAIFMINDDSEYEIDAAGKLPIPDGVYQSKEYCPECNTPAILYLRVRDHESKGIYI